MGILSTIFGQRPSASPDSITFDVSRYEFQGDRDGARVWFLPEGGASGFMVPGCADSVADVRSAGISNVALHLSSAWSGRDR
jgi:hypothetical protein